mgnify:FL=1
MAITANGMIATASDDTSWVSSTEWKSFSRRIGKVGNMIIGSRTYEIMQKKREFDRLQGVKVVVLSRTARKLRPGFSSAASPQSALAMLRSWGFTTVMVCGGGTVNASFMKEKLIDEMCLDVEPVILGKGIPLFRNADFQAKLRLQEITRLSRNEIQLRYRLLP